MFYGSAYERQPDDFGFQWKGVATMPEEKVGDFEPDPFAAQLLEFADAVSSGREPESSLSRNLNTLGVIEAIYTSINRGGATVRVAEIMDTAETAT